MSELRHSGLGARQADAYPAIGAFDDRVGAAHVRALMIFAKTVSSGALGAIVIGVLWFAYILLTVGK
jgi:hypothetical protein